MRASVGGMCRTTALVICAAFGMATASSEGRAPSSAVTLRSIIVDAVSASTGLRVATAGVFPLTVEALARRLVATLSRDRSVVAHLPSTECLLAIAPDGSLLGEVEGNEGEVALGRSFDEPLQRAGAGILLVHNHPRGNALSGADLGQLSKAGVGGIIAVGHDGSVYGASAGPTYDPITFEVKVYPLARAEALRRLRRQAPGARVEMEVFDAHVEHVIALGLHEARVIRYIATLVGSRQDAYRRLDVVFRHVAEGVAATVSAASRGHGTPAADPSQPPASPIRSHHLRILNAIDDAGRRSATFRNLVERLNRSDVIVYIESGRCGTAQVMSCIAVASTAGSYRYLRVTIDTNHSFQLITSEIAHELQHAVEIADAPDVVDGATLRALFRRIGATSAGRDIYETTNARAVAARVSLELSTP